MERPRISLIAALGARTRAIGNRNGLLWHIPPDLRRFKELTTGHPIIMGRKTYESIGKPLPGRLNIVLSDVLFEAPPEVRVCSSIEGALETASATRTDEIFIIGGGQVYAQTIAIVDRMYLTLVDDDAPGATFLPEVHMLPFREVEREEHSHEGLRFAFVLYEKTA